MRTEKCPFALAGRGEEGRSPGSVGAFNPHSWLTWDTDELPALAQLLFPQAEEYVGRTEERS